MDGSFGRNEGPEWVLQKFEKVLSAAARATQQIPDELIDWTSPERGRVLRQFTFHIFDRPNTMLNAYEKGSYNAEDRGRNITDALESRDVADIVQYGEEVMARIRKFFNQATQETLEEAVDTYMGQMSVQQLLDLGLGHSVHHLKQLYSFMVQIGITPDSPLSERDFEGVAVPTELF
ncbi:MAG: DinB family protein [Dehalococcoidia bacterium]